MRKRMKRRRRSRTENVQGKKSRKYTRREEILLYLFVVHLAKKTNSGFLVSNVWMMMNDELEGM
jgi:hypothetical protein